MGTAEENAAQLASTIESNFNITGWLPKGAVRRALDADVANEGQRVVDKGAIMLSDGTRVPYIKPQEKPRIPDWSQIESIKHYFGPRGYQPYPSWFYHKTKDAVLVKDAKEAAEYGIVFRKTTEDERQRFGRNETWDWEEGCEWRPHPIGVQKVNVADYAGSKHLVHGAPDSARVQADLVASVAASVAEVLKRSAAPSGFSGKDWDEFVAFQAWKKANEVVAAEVVREDITPSPEMASLSENALSANALSPEQDRMLWENEAERLGIKVDKRWGLDRLKAEIEKASAA